MATTQARTRTQAKAGRGAAKPVKTTVRPLQRARQAAPGRTRSSPPSLSESVEGVRQVLSRYCFALDTLALQEVGALFHRDATFSVSFDREQQHTGRETIKAWYARFFQQRPGQYSHMRHKLYEPRVTIHGDTATAVTYFDSDAVDQDGKIIVIAGRYDDTLVRESGQWFFKDRRITVLYHYSPGTSREGMR
ncbi:MAG: nuclear transport factor 2 family protein [Deltaproteobacteria bacterium]|nr:nuclear transport factor 2 family protein [Deltaproteobacteria bacterium]